eukprot:g1950.t2
MNGLGERIVLFVQRLRGFGEEKEHISGLFVPGVDDSRPSSPAEEHTGGRPGATPGTPYEGPVVTQPNRRPVELNRKEPETQTVLQRQNSSDDEVTFIEDRLLVMIPCQRRPKRRPKCQPRAGPWGAPLGSSSPSPHLREGWLHASALLRVRAREVKAICQGLKRPRQRRKVDGLQRV